jgi:hypothetical protein
MGEEGVDQVGVDGSEKAVGIEWWKERPEIDKHLRGMGRGDDGMKEEMGWMGGVRGES